MTLDYKLPEQLAVSDDRRLDNVSTERLKEEQRLALLHNRRVGDELFKRMMAVRRLRAAEDDPSDGA